MTNEFNVEGIEEMPVYLVSPENTTDFSTADLILGVPLRDLLAGAAATDKLYLVHHASRPGRTRLTLLT